MSKTTAIILGAFLFFFWIANVAIVQIFGPGQELYPFTCFPMFRGPIPIFREYHFLVVSDPGTTPQRMTAGKMFSGGTTGGGDVAAYSLRALQDRLVRGEPVPETMAQLWRRNSQKYLGIEHSPSEIRLIRTDYPLDRELKDIRSSGREVVVLVLLEESGRDR